MPNYEASRINRLKIEISILLQNREHGLTVEQVKKHLGESLDGFVLNALLDLKKDGVVRFEGETWRLMRRSVSD